MTDSVPVRRSALQSLWRALPYLLAAAAIYLMWAPRRSGPDEGATAAHFDLPAIDGSGGRVRFDALRGKPMLIEVFASWCTACRNSAAAFRDVAQAHRQSPVHFVAVSVDDDPRDGAAAARDWGFKFDVVHDDGRFSRDYGISVLPTLILVDAEGNIRRVATGGVGRGKLEGWLTEIGAQRL